jgi:hypothetical protein
VTLNGIDDPNRIGQVYAVQFDDSGKFLAYAGPKQTSTNEHPDGGSTTTSTEMIVAITTIKKWDRTATFRMSNVEITKNGLLWDKNLKYIAASVIETNSNETLTPKVICFDLA